MDFGLSDDQKLLEETLRGYLADRVPIERVRELREKDCPNDREIWQGLCELGMAGVLVPEAQGGSGLALLDAALVSQALGFAATPAPFLSSGVIATVALRELAASGEAVADEWLEGIASGSKVVGVALTELFSVREGAGMRLRGGRLEGKALMALDAFGADGVLLALEDRSVALIAASDASILRLTTVDATRCTSEVVVDGVAPIAHFAGPSADRALARALDAGRIALAADALGCCDAMLARAVAYAKERKQFDRAIGSFQAVKHMCAEMVAEIEPARSLLWYSAHSFDATPDETPELACHVLSHVSEIAREIASVSTQVHGGIGWTDEQNLHFWFKRIATARHLLGGPELLRTRAAALQRFAQ